MNKLLTGACLAVDVCIGAVALFAHTDDVDRLNQSIVISAPPC